MKRALCIGINDYPGTENDLAGCCNDADDWAAALAARGFDVRRLLDSAASGAAIRAGIRELLTTATDGDAVIITYSGHGTWVPDADGDEPDHRDEAICPHDIAENGVLLDDELHDLFALAAGGVRTVLISDSCHSGTLTRLNHPIGDHPSRTRFLPPSTFLTPQQRLRAAQLPPAQPRSASPRLPQPPATPRETRRPAATRPEPSQPVAATPEPSRPGTLSRPEPSQPVAATPEPSRPGTVLRPEASRPAIVTRGPGQSAAAATQSIRTVAAHPGRPAHATRPVDQRPTALLLAGCLDTEYSYDATFNDRPNGAFTYVALAALAGLPSTATYRDWLRAIRAVLPSQDYPQTPALQATTDQLAWPLLS